MSKTKIVFLASIPPVSAALKFGNGTARVMLEVPETEVENMVGLIALQSKPLRITVEVEE